jgi:DNA repair protein SbcD/Mre11
LVAKELAVLHLGADGRPLAVRIEISGASAAHERLQADTQKWINEIRTLAVATGGGQVWIEKVKIRTRPPASCAANGDGPISELLAVLAEFRAQNGSCQQLRDAVADLSRKLPPQLTEGPEALRLDDPAWLQGMLDRVEPLLVQRLLSRGNSQ